LKLSVRASALSKYAAILVILVGILMLFYAFIFGVIVVIIGVFLYRYQAKLSRRADGTAAPNP
jgi:hypothetical protein